MSFVSKRIQVVANVIPGSSKARDPSKAVPVGLSAAQRKNEKRREKKKVDLDREATESPAMEQAAPLGEKEIIEKKIKAVNKKLRQIQDLEAKKAAGNELDSLQQVKLDSKEVLETELGDLEAEALINDF